ncbi:hypothetical protein HELRODRAFT_63361 [Helobdella robusta]|uniref:DUF4062 domain-containing protein n=1 Tax=Helobdella robusta TaxID=6412 RepID=T1FXE9_HELRO|nr:hypothetical protein HELRODRAFT_63361 [Helobdella robusta]ESO12419.1 hypothetical protein HELRODRAFT_63361 [Helobdella robusta]
MLRKVSLRYSDADKYEDGTLHAILEGHLKNLPPLSTRLVRVFISSTFSDMIQERNCLMENSYFKLKSYCLEKYRLEFQMIDLRWGLREESQDDHTIIEFCIKEIEKCKHLSIGPSFVALLGQKYGYRSFPSTIEAKEFEIMREALLCNGKDINLLSKWYQKDENIIPNVYTLQPISSIIKNYTNSDVGLKQTAREEWEKVFSQLQHILRLGVLLCTEQNLISRKEKEKYFISVTEYEILKGMLESSQAKHTSFCLTRNISNLEENIHNKRARKFIDLLPDNDVIDRDAQQMLNNLKKTKIKPLYGKSEENMEHFEITWTDLEQSDPTENDEYLKHFCEVFENKVKLLVDKALTNLRNITRNTQVVEIHQHLNMCRNRSQVFRGRDDHMKKLKDYLSRPAKYPLVLYGLSGSGKTSVLAQCANLIKIWFPQSTPTVIIRFLGK